jgi:23S rRNA A1618 N6-methylase RlmF
MKRQRDSGTSDEPEGHPLSIYSHARPDFAALAEAFPSLASFLSSRGLDFSNPRALIELTRALLFVDFDLSVEFPVDRLCPTVTSRLNYVLYISDLLQRTPRLRIEGNRYVRESFGGDTGVLGLDIGCGASAIYSLLAARLFGWRFVCSELDAVSLSSARRNAARNGLDDVIIRFVQVSDVTAAVRACFNDTDELPMFTMCNPPFFEDFEEEAAQGPNNTVITESEAVTVGGEVDFVRRIIEDSLYYRDKIALYSSLLGKKSSLKRLKAMLVANSVPVVHITRLVQGKGLSLEIQKKLIYSFPGRTHRWVLAWSFRTPSFPCFIARPSSQVFDEVAAFLRKSNLELQKCERTTLTLTSSLAGAFVFEFRIAVDHKSRSVASSKLLEGDKDMFGELERLLKEQVSFV